MNKNIINKNNKGEYHGYNEIYSYFNNRLWIRATYKNNNRIGYAEWHWGKETNFYIR